MLMKPVRTLLLCGVLAGALVAQACGKPTFVVAHYSGPVQPRETLGVVRVNGDESLELLAIDGDAANARVVEDARLHIEILPGKHSVWVQDANLRDVPGQRVRFTAEAGKVYRPAFVNAGGRPSARVFEVDRNSDALLKDVTLLEAAEPASSVAPELRPPPETGAPPAPPVAPSATSPAAPSAAPPPTQGQSAAPLQPPTPVP